MNQFIKKPETIQSQSYKIIKDRIIKGEYLSKERITEAGLARHLGVSRGTIRESVKTLIQEGLIIQEGRILKIFEPSLETALDIYYCRERLETLAARLAAERISEEEIKSLFNIVDDTEIALFENDTSKISQLNSKFHLEIINKSHNQELSKLMSNIIDKIACIRSHLHQTNLREDDFIVEHKSIVRAISIRDSDKAESEMSKHIKKDLEAVRLLYDQKNITM